MQCFDDWISELPEITDWVAIIFSNETETNITKIIIYRTTARSPPSDDNILLLDIFLVNFFIGVLIVFCK